MLLLISFHMSFSLQRTAFRLLCHDCQTQSLLTSQKDSSLQVAVAVTLLTRTFQQTRTLSKISIFYQPRLKLPRILLSKFKDQTYLCQCKIKQWDRLRTKNSEKTFFLSPQEQTLTSLDKNLSLLKTQSLDRHLDLSKQAEVPVFSVATYPLEILIFLIVHKTK